MNAWRIGSSLVDRRGANRGESYGASGRPQPVFMTVAQSLTTPLGSRPTICEQLAIHRWASRGAEGSSRSSRPRRPPPAKELWTRFPEGLRQAWTNHEARNSGPRGLRIESLVELGGLEPPTSWVRLRLVGRRRLFLALLREAQFCPIRSDLVSSVAPVVARLRWRHQAAVVAKLGPCLTWSRRCCTAASPSTLLSRDRDTRGLRARRRGVRRR